jgi:hypothetical protein
MRKLLCLFLLVASLKTIAQPLNAHSATEDLTITLPDGRLSLTDAGASYFANLSLSCTDSAYPHFYMEHLKTAQDLQPPEKLWPSFYGCYDWHSGVHNHWALVKILKTYPNIKEAAAIKDKLEQSFNADNILQELKYMKSHQEDDFEFPYGTSWLLKVAEELNTWDDPLAKKWFKNLQPLTDFLVEKYIKQWPTIDEATYTGDHYSSAFGLSFALDYARSVKNDKLEAVCIDASKKFYGSVTTFPLVKEPFGYDFMSAGLLIADLMRKVLPQADYVIWLQSFAPDLFSMDGIPTVLAVKRLTVHDGYASHWDGFHLNRIWCLNGILQSLPDNTLSAGVKKSWIDAQKEMWDYAQESIGKGNYDVDHWLSSFSVFALEGYKQKL